MFTPARAVLVCVFAVISCSQLSEPAGPGAARAADALLVSGASFVKDINPVLPTGVTSSSPLKFRTLGGVTFFVATESSTGTELWRTDGTAAGTFLVTDLNTGTSSSFPNELTVLNGELYFTATDGNSGTELWKTKGTSATTELVADIYPGTLSSAPAGLRVAGTTLYFNATNGTVAGVGAGRELWKTTGTPASTSMVTDLNPGTASGLVSTTASTAVAVGSVLIFVGTDGTNGTELFRTDGTALGTSLLLDIATGTASSSPTNLIVKGTEVLFSASPGTAAGQSGRELWKTDGTAAGTALVADLNAGIASSSPAELTLAGSSRVFFTATNGTSGPELFITDGTALGTTLVSDIRPGTLGSIPNNLSAVGTWVYFAANDGTTGIELWKSDGSAAGTVLVKDIFPGTATSSSAPGAVVAAGGTLLFTAGAGGSTIDRELWKTDGTPAGTVLVKDIAPGTTSAVTTTTELFAAGAGVLFAATDGVSGVELWTSDGTAAGTVQLEDLNPTRTNNSSPAQLTAFGSRVFFAASDGVSGIELGRSDGTPAGTTQLDLATGLGSSSPSNLTVLNNALLFSASNGTVAPAVGRELWITDGTDAGTMVLKDLNVGTASSSPSNFARAGQTVFFSATTAAEGNELWKTDGTAAGTLLVSDVVTGTVGSSPLNLTPLGSRVLFSAFETATGRELWASDGTAAGTARLADLNPGTASASPGNLTPVGSTVFFTATDGVNGIELWKTDGTTAGTVLVKDLNPGPTSATISQLTAVGPTLFFAANDGTSGQELWKTDGTAAGTVRVIDLVAGVGGATLTSLTAAGSVLLFSANDGVSGEELWKSDGTPAGTVLVRDIFPGQRSASPAQFFAAGSTLLFSADNGINGVELWISDGTLAGTVLAADLNPKASSSPSAGALAGLTYFFAAFDPTRGIELFAAPVVDNTAPVVTCPANVAAFSNAGPKAVSYPNALAIDDVSASPAISYSKASGTLFPLGPTAVTATATDGSANSGQCTFTVTVTADTTAPVATCPANVAQNTSVMTGSTVTYAPATATDDLSSAPVLTYSAASGTSFAVGTTAVTATATDLAGNTGTCTFNVVVTFVDTIAPAITCPGNQSKVVNALGSTGVTYPPATATDLVTASPVITYSVASGAMFPIGVTAVTATATDAAGNFSTCVFNVTVTFVDNTPPVVTCPADQVALATAMTGVVVIYPAATAVDAVTLSPAVSYSQASGTLFPLGETGVTATATDAAGNNGTCTFKVTVTFSDSTPPVVVCPANQQATVAVMMGTAVTYPPATATDAVTASPVITYSKASGTVFMVGETTVTATATDAAGNNASCTFKVTVAFVDTQAPVITCPPTAIATTAGAATTVTYPPATATESAVLTYSQASGSVFSVGATSVIATATDAAGNASSCTFVVKVAKTAAKGGGCGCASTGEQSGLMFALLGAAAVLARRRRRS